MGWGRPAENRGSRRDHDGGVTRDRFAMMAQHCAEMGLPVTWADLGEKRRGNCQALEGKVTLNLRLTMAQAASTLAHEVGHWEFGDMTSTASNERRAWEFGAALLIEPWEYAEAERLVGHHLSALAIELGVTPKLIEAWRRWWATRAPRERLALEFGYHDGCQTP